jgi:hypothetical protein
MKDIYAFDDNQLHVGIGPGSVMLSTDGNKSWTASGELKRNPGTFTTELSVRPVSGLKHVLAREDSHTEPLVPELVLLNQKSPL